MLTVYKFVVNPNSFQKLKKIENKINNLFVSFLYNLIYNNLL
jgi:hypothetical protein